MRGKPSATTEQDSVAWREILTRKHLPGLLVLCLALWLHASNSMLAATTLPTAVAEIGGLEFISWAFALYLMGSILAATMVSASVANYGLRLTMVGAALIYTLGCLTCATAPSMAVMLGGRTLLGLGGGALVALVYIAQDRFFPSRLVPRIVACLSVVWVTSALSGPLIGGSFATAGVWRLAFWTFALQGLLLVAVVRPLLARVGSESVVQRRRIPVVRLSLVAGAILAVSSAGNANSVVWASALILLGCACLWLFAYRDSGACERTRLLPFHATDLDHPVGCGIAMSFVLCLCMMSYLVYGPVLLIRLHGLTPLESGLVIFAESLGWTAGAVFLSGVAPAHARILVRTGSAMLLLGIAAQAWLMAHGPLWLIIAAAFFGTAGFGMMWGHIIKLVVMNSSAEERDRAGSLLPCATQTGFALGAALSGVFAHALGFEDMVEAEEFRVAAFWLFAGFVPPALLGNAIAWKFCSLIPNGDSIGERESGVDREPSSL